MNTVLLKGASARVFLGSQYIAIYKALGLAWVAPTQARGCDGVAGRRNTTSIDRGCDLGLLEPRHRTSSSSRIQT